MEYINGCLVGTKDALVIMPPMMSGPSASDEVKVEMRESQMCAVAERSPCLPRECFVAVMVSALLVVLDAGCSRAPK